MKVVICEDNNVCANSLENHIIKWASEYSNLINVYTYESAEHFLFAIEDLNCIDLIFIDIKMGKMNGIELAHKLREEKFLGQIVFTTDLKEYVFEGYNVSALNYLIKPISYDACSDILNRVCTIISEQRFYLCKTQNSIIRIPYDEILYIEMSSHYAIVTTSSTKYTTRTSMSNLLSELDNEIFIRCHKSFVVNVCHVMSLSRKSLTVSNKTNIDIGNKFLKNIHHQFIKYNMNRR